jgi:hypothetical protein
MFMAKKQQDNTPEIEASKSGPESTQSAAPTIPPADQSPEATRVLHLFK